MYEEPFRWIEAVGNRRQYLDDQFKQGSPIIALSYSDGILLFTFGRGTPKLYEIYDRIALGGMGHPADLEKLRFSLLDLAHVEGFNRSPSDVSATRLMKYGLAPMIKQAFEEIFKAPLITKILLAELGVSWEQDRFLTIDYDGTFDETPNMAVVASDSSIQTRIRTFVKSQIDGTIDRLEVAIEVAIRAWAFGSLLQNYDQGVEHQGENKEGADITLSKVEPNEKNILDHVRLTVTNHHFECALLERSRSGSSKYRSLLADEVKRLLPSVLQTVV